MIKNILFTAMLFCSSLVLSSSKQIIRLDQEVKTNNGITRTTAEDYTTFVKPNVLFATFYNEKNTRRPNTYEAYDFSAQPGQRLITNQYLALASYRKLEKEFGQ